MQYLPSVLADTDTLAGVFRLSLSGLTRADLHGLRWTYADLDAGTVTIRQGRVALHHGETRDVTSMGRVAGEVRAERSLHRAKGEWKIDTPKTKAASVVPLPRALREELAEYLEQHPHADDPDAALWPGRIPGTGGGVSLCFCQVDWTSFF